MIAPWISVAVLASPLLLPAGPGTAVPTAPEEAPPGMVLVPGGRTKVGTAFKDMVKLLEDNPQLQNNAGGFLAEVPEHTVSVDDFYLMVTEVSNEQYREYVKAAGAQPPVTWGEEAINAARQAYLVAEGERRQKAKEEGRPAPERVPFVETEWWERNWKDAEWKMPKELAHKPVVYTDYQDARGYAEWAGLRLPDENEFERAVRGDSTRTYAWGDEFKPGEQAATVEIPGVSDVFPVGSFPNGASPQGVLDLAGNVWEWTSSSYVAYPGWKHKSFTVGKGSRKKEIDTPPSFSPNRRVVKSGSMQNSRFHVRGTIRGGFERFQKAAALGFRCAASTRKGYDFAVTRKDNIPSQIRPQTDDGPVIYDPNQVIAMDRWLKAETDCKVPGYSVIKSYDFILFTPVEALPTTGVADITKGAKNDEVFHLGFLATSKDMVEPALPAGTYLVALRGAGKASKKADEEKPAEGEDEAAPETSGLLRDLLEFDTSVDNFLFFDMTGAPVAAVEATKLEYANPTSSELAVVDRTILVPTGEKDETMEVIQKWLDLNLFVKGKSRKGVKTTLSLRFPDGVLEGEWR